MSKELILKYAYILNDISLIVLSLIFLIVFNYVRKKEFNKKKLKEVNSIILLVFIFFNTVLIFSER